MLGTTLWEKIDLVLSGINIGTNLGNAIWHSGTLAGAKQAALLGLRGIAFSAPATDREQPSFEMLKPWVATVLEALLEVPDMPLINVNFPAKPPRGTVWTRQSMRHYDGKVVPAKDPMGRTHYWFTVVPVEATEEGTDRWAIEQQYVSMTPLRLDLTDEEALGGRAGSSRAGRSSSSRSASMIRIGISGWRYEPWRGVWYPEGLAQRRELEFCGRHFPTRRDQRLVLLAAAPGVLRRLVSRDAAGLPVRGQGLALHHAPAAAEEHRQAARQFLRFRHLQPARQARAVPVAVPAEFGLRPRAVRRILLAAAADYDRGARARAPAGRAHDRPLAPGHRRRPRRCATRSRSATPASCTTTSSRCCRKHGIGLVVADTAGKWPKLFHVTADFVYVRLHGDVKIYTSGYTDRALDELGAPHSRLGPRRPRRLRVLRQRREGEGAVRRAEPDAQAWPELGLAGARARDAGAAPQVRVRAARYGRESRVGRPATIRNS